MRKFSALIKSLPLSLDFALFDSQPALFFDRNISDFRLAYTCTAWGLHVIVKHISYLMCLPIMTDYLWPVEHKLSMWWFKSGALCRPAGHMLGIGFELLPTWCKNSGNILKHHCTVAILRPDSLWKRSKLYKIPSVQWTCLFEVLVLWNAS